MFNIFRICRISTLQLRQKIELTFMSRSCSDSNFSNEHQDTLPHCLDKLLVAYHITTAECRSDNIHWIIGQVTQYCGMELHQWFPALSMEYVGLCWVESRAFIKWRGQFRLVISCLLGVMHRLTAVALIYACLCSASVIAQETVWPLPHYVIARSTSLVVDPSDFDFKVRFYHLFFLISYF